MVTLLHGDCRELLPTLPPASVQCVVTSPPYWGLRDYGTAEWDGGDPECLHTYDRSMGGRASTLGGGTETQSRASVYRSTCGKCGAQRIDRQIGLEQTPTEYVDTLVNVFDSVWRVLKDNGTLWLNLGDSYAGSWGAMSYAKGDVAARRFGGDNKTIARPVTSRLSGDLKNKDLVGIPWMVAFALRSAGWYLRCDVVWHKPNPMPESVTDRPTRAHEYLFLLSKSEKYYYDAEAIKEPAVNGDPNAGHRPQTQRAIELAREKGLTQEHIDAIRAAGLTDAGKNAITQNGTGNNTERVQQLAAEAKAALGGYYREFLLRTTRNRRSVWTISTTPYTGAHFATFPEKLIEPCILASSRPGDTVLDMFAGSGTVMRVAERYGRDSIGIDLNPAYIELQKKRTNGVQVHMEALL